LLPFASLAIGANLINRLPGYGGAASRIYQISSVDAAKVNGTTAGDWCYAVDTNKFYIWTSGAAWVAR
jgi:hypothetical protein